VGVDRIIAEAGMWQLRGEAGARQAADARIAVPGTIGGGRDGNACAVAVLERG
jgi:hypothetical protein